MNCLWSNRSVNADAAQAARRLCSAGYWERYVAFERIAYA